MIFSSVTFLFYFLPLFLILYFITPFKNTVLLIASLFFYAWGEAQYTLLLLVSIFFNYLFGLLIDRYRNQIRSKNIMLFFGISINLSLIAYYKYFNFLAEAIFQYKANNPVHLPLGISFFTFQAISYLVDVYRNEAKVEKNPFNLALYISMFPQLIAGPIVRFKTVAEQIVSRKHTVDNFYSGMKIFLIGLAQKALIANTVALTADQVFSLPQSALTTGTAWIGTLCYSLQIYFDFAGYSNMAIGLGLIMGFTFPVNFNYPYISQSITEFWRRWHISLSTWFRDYLYIPLGGNRVSPARTYFNLMLVFLLCGLWHGAATTFLIWGGYHGLFLMLERYTLSKFLNKLWRPFRHFYTLLVVMIGWVIFRANDLAQLNYFLKALFGFNGAQQAVTTPITLNHSTTTTLILGLIFSLPIMITIKNRFATLKSNNQKIQLLSSQLLLDIFIFSCFFLSLIYIASGSYNPFIYFRF